MTKAFSSEIVVVLDRSGSMAPLKDDMEGGFDAFIEEQRKVPGDCRVTLVQFDDKYEMVYQALPLSEVPRLKLAPRNSTALYDAVGKTINDVGSRLAAMQERDRPSQVIFVIITDGIENASQEFSRENVFGMVTHQRERYQWEFVYLGANQDAYLAARHLGVSILNTVGTQNSRAGARATFGTVTRGVGQYRNSGKSQMNEIVSETSYNLCLNEEEAKEAAIGTKGEN